MLALRPLALQIFYDQTGSWSKIFRQEISRPLRQKQLIGLLYGKLYLYFALYILHFYFKALNSTLLASFLMSISKGGHTLKQFSTTMNPIHVQKANICILNVKHCNIFPVYHILIFVLKCIMHNFQFKNWAVSATQFKFTMTKDK